MQTLSPNTIEAYLEYSEQPEKLQELLQDISVSYDKQGIKKYFPGDKEERMVLTIEIKRGCQEISFSYAMSIRDTAILTFRPPSFDDGSNYRFEKQYHVKANTFTIKREREKIWNGLLYNILTRCAIDYYCDKDFDYWCAEFGYDTDSRKAYEIWHKHLAQSAKLERIFNDDEIECLPR
jgi:hypothetical protein